MQDYEIFAHSLLPHEYLFFLRNINDVNLYFKIYRFVVMSFYIPYKMTFLPKPLQKIHFFFFSFSYRILQFLAGGEDSEHIFYFNFIIL